MGFYNGEWYTEKRKCVHKYSSEYLCYLATFIKNDGSMVVSATLVLVAVVFIPPPPPVSRVTAVCRGLARPTRTVVRCVFWGGGGVAMSTYVPARRKLARYTYPRPSAVVTHPPHAYVVLCILRSTD